MDSIDLSIVVPLYNEAANARLLHAEVVNALAGTSLSYELILVDDGSRDDTFRRAVELVDIDPRVRVFALRRNYGQTAATSAGIRGSRGRIIVTMDGDLQNDPTDIPRLLALLDNGYHIVVGWRRKRMDKGARVLVSKAANWIMARMMGVAVRDSGCSLRAYHAELIQGLPLYGEMHRFIPALSRLAGAKLAEIEVKHRPRRFGVSKYGFARIYKVMLDIVTIRILLSYARRPLWWHGNVAAVCCVIGITIVLMAIRFGDSETLVVEAGIGVLFISLGLFLISWGVVAQMLALQEPYLAQFASLAATLSSRVASKAKCGSTAA